MSAVLSSAARKILTALMSNRKTARNLLLGILSVFLALIMPAIAVAGIFSGTVTVDADRLLETIQEHLSPEDMAMLQGVETNMEAISAAMDAAGFPQREKEAQILYILALSELEDDGDLISKLVGCFSGSQTDADLIERVNAAFGTDIRTEDFTRIASTLRPTVIQMDRYLDPSTKNSHDLVQWAMAAEKSGWGYVWGTFGHILTEASFAAKFNQYPEAIGPYEAFIREHWIGVRTTDCVGLIKGYCWLDGQNGTIRYAANGMPDVDTDGLYAFAREKGTLDTMPELPGVVVWRDGHVGIYIGEGCVIEAKGTYYGVVKTKLEQGAWSHWLKVPCITYEEEVS